MLCLQVVQRSSQRDGLKKQQQLSATHLISSKCSKELFLTNFDFIFIIGKKYSKFCILANFDFIFCRYLRTERENIQKKFFFFSKNLKKKFTKFYKISFSFKYVKNNLNLDSIIEFFILFLFHFFSVC